MAKCKDNVIQIDILQSDAEEVVKALDLALITLVNQSNITKCVSAIARLNELQYEIRNQQALAKFTKAVCKRKK